MTSQTGKQLQHIAQYFKSKAAVKFGQLIE